MSVRLMMALAAIGSLGSRLAQVPVASPPATTVRSGVYTAAQAKRGESVYLNACSHCHLYDLSGGRDPDGVGDSPPLAGDGFRSDWDGETVATLFDTIRKTMPYDKPGTLTVQEDADVLAYILSANKFSAGDRELATDVAELGRIRMTRTP